jgi:hypothetical protein
MSTPPLTEQERDDLMYAILVRAILDSPEALAVLVRDFEAAREAA